MNIEKLVADRELCEQIPADEFMDAAFCWHYTDVAGFTCGTSGCRQFSGKQWMLERSNSSKIIRYRQRGEVIFPAPNLVEIMAKLPHTICYKHAEPGHYTMRTGGGFDLFLRDENPSTAAMKMWLELNKKGN